MGVGKDVYKEGKAMSEIAGENGKVLLYPDFDNLSGQLDDILIATCGKLFLLNCSLSRSVLRIVQIEFFLNDILLKSPGSIYI